MKRILSLLLAAALLAAPMPVQAAESGPPPDAVGTISATVRVDHPQTLDALKARDVKVTLKKGSTAIIDALSLTEEKSEKVGDYPAAVALRNTDGGELGGSQYPGYLDVTVSNLPKGSYTLEFTGKGYVPCSKAVTLEDYSQYVTVGTGDATFTLGDLNGDKKVDATDRTLISGVLGSTKPEDLAAYDLNGDGKIDIIDLAYVSRHIKATGAAEVQDTFAIDPGVDMAGIEVNGAKLERDDLANLFRADDSTVELPAPADGKPTTLAIPFAEEEPQEMEEIQIVSPEGTGALQTGTVTVEGEDENGNPIEMEIPFDLTPPVGVHAIGPVPGSSVVKIALGRRVAVKKITISVTRTEDGGLAVIESIQFLKDIVPENPAPANNQVRNLRAEPGDEQVSLKWGALPNVSGYRVDYVLYENSEETGETRSLPTDKNEAVVSGLENGMTYRFTVTPVDGSWEGVASNPVYAAPQTAKAPDAPDSVSVSALDTALRVSWKAAETATYYEVFYKLSSEGDDKYVQWGEQLTVTNTTVTGLTNGVEYSLYVVAGNSIGRSGPSRISVGTPSAVDYSRPAGIPTEGVIDYNDIERVWLRDSGNWSGKEFPDSSLRKESNMADGDFKTNWTSQSWGDGNFSRSKQVLCTFKEPQDLYNVIWVTRLDGTYSANLRLYTVSVWQEGDDLNGEGTLLVPDPNRGGIANNHNTWPNVGGNTAANKFAVLPIEPVMNVVKVAITIEQRDYTPVSLSELMFLRYDPEKCLPDNITALFADDLRTTLKPEVTQADIDALRTRLNSDERNYYLNLDAMADELNLAEELLTGTSSGVILRGIESRNPSSDNKYQQGGSVLQPLGAAAMANSEITIYASGIPDGQTVNVTATQFNAEVTAWQAQAGTLRNGRNLITIPRIGSQNTPRGGSLYLTYSGPNPEGITLHIRRGTAIPKLELSDWYSLNEGQRRERIGAYVDALAAYVPAQNITDANRTTNCLNVTEISTPVVLLSLPAAAVLGNIGQDRDTRIETVYQNILAWEDVMHLCKTTQGIDNTYEKNDMATRQNIRCMQMFAGAFMYAAGNHIGIGYGSCGGVSCGRPLSAENPSLFGWGIAHEIGHNMDKLGKAEITNNIYSLVVQTVDKGSHTGTSRLEVSGKYPKIFTKTAQAYPGDSNDVFLQLGLYWQLHLAYDDVNNLDFYNRFFKAWKSGQYFGGETAYGDRLARTASAVANRDLTEFFTRWGVALSANTRTALAQYPEESRAVWYLSDQSRRERLNGTTPASGSLTVTAGISEGTDNEVVLNITPSITGELQGYEIRRSSDGGRTFRSIGFTSSETYTDVIGSANNRTYTYQVAAYDILGNKVCESNSNEVRIAYDKTVDPSAYTLTRNGTDVTFTMTEATPVSGLKVRNAPADGSFTVSVTTAVDETEQTTTARSGNFANDNQATDNSSYLTYFQKPGVSSEDTRIWTYDALRITVTGIPETVADSDLQLISYAGDNVAFLEDGAVGILSADYDCGNGEIIPEGTLVIVGTYRGDPVWQTVRIEGKFTSTTVTEDGEQTENTEEEIRPIDGDAYLFAEIPEDGAVSDISDGLFLFVPNVQKESELQGDTSHCNAVNLLPAQMRAVLSRTDNPDSADSQRVTAETLWINTPGGTDLPVIVLEE